MSTASKPSDSSQNGSSKSVSEFSDGRKIPPYTWSTSFSDWWRQSWSSRYSDREVESRLLSFLPFFPESDGQREAQIIDTDVGNGNFIHEFYIENTEKTAEKSSSQHALASPVKDIVLVHGYAASLGLFFDNFESLSSIPGVRVHAIDMLGFGFSSRPDFPKYKTDTKADIYQCEDWFIDSLEEWRKRRGIEKFVLVGHSFGGYLSCAYAMKYNQRAEGKPSLIEKLVLLSPVGVERHEKSLLKSAGLSENQVSASEKAAEDSQDPAVSISKEITANQEDLMSKFEVKEEGADNADAKKDSKSFRQRIFPYLWEKNVSPFSLVRNAGPVKSKMISRWTTHRFSHIFYTNPEKFQSIHDYFYRIFNAAGSGEYAITRVLAVGALARLPLLDRCPEKFVKMNLPTLWLYGDKDWMNRDAGQEMVDEVNALCKAEKKRELAQFGIISNAGHHLYLDNPPQFADKVLQFIQS